VSLASVARSYRLEPKEFEKQYKDHISDFRNWDQKSHAEEWMLFPRNVGKHLSIDEVAVTNGELWTVVTNKAKHGKKGALTAMVKGTKASDIAKVLLKIPEIQRYTVTEVTMDMAENMEAAVRRSFPRAKIVTDRFHVQQLVSDAVQEMRIELKRTITKEENEAIKKAKAAGKGYHPAVFENGDTKKQLLARSRYLLFKPKGDRNDQQQERSAILFREYPLLKTAYDLSMMFRGTYEHSTTIAEARAKLQAWYRKIEEKKLDAFLVPMESIRLHETTILNYFVNRSTNASAESFNAKLKNFRTAVRGVTDKTFHLFRVATLYG